MKFRVFVPLALLILPGLAHAQAPRTFGELVNVLVIILNNATAVLVILGLVVYFYGVSTNIMSFDSEKGKEKVKAYFFWGVIVLFVMVSIWGIIEILQNTFLGDNSYGAGLQQQNVQQSQFNLPVFPQ